MSRQVRLIALKYPSSECHLRMLSLPLVIAVPPSPPSTCVTGNRARFCRGLQTQQLRLRAQCDDSSCWRYPAGSRRQQTMGIVFYCSLLGKAERPDITGRRARQVHNRIQHLNHNHGTESVYTINPLQCNSCSRCNKYWKLTSVFQYVAISGMCRCTKSFRNTVVLNTM